MDLITREIAAYRQLLELTIKEKDAIVKNLVQEVDSVVANQRAVLSNINKLNAQRLQLFRIFSQGCGISAPVMRDIINAAKGEIKNELKEKSAELNNVAEDLKKAGSVNKKLLEEHAKYATLCINLIAEPANSMDTYSNSGRLSSENQVHYRLLDQSV